MVEPSAPDAARRPPLARAWRLVVLGQLLLLLAGLRHHLVWGESPRLPFSLRPALDAFETACLVGLVWWGGRGWWRAMEVVRGGALPFASVLRLTVPVLLLAVLVPAFVSADAADYVMRGRVLAVHGGNPYVQMASDFPGDPFLAFGDAGWKDFPLPYGPLVAELQGGVVWLAHLAAPVLPPRAEFVLALLLFKLVFAGCLVAAALGVRGLARRLGQSPAATDALFVGVAWNPLLLLESVATAHNESVVLLPVVLGVAALAAGRAATSVVALAVAVLAKLVPVVLGPMALVAIVRTRRLVPALGGAVLAAGLAAFCWWRFFRAPGALDFVARQAGQTWSSFAWAGSQLGLDPAHVVLGGRIVAGAVVVVGALRLWRAPMPERLPAVAAAALAAFFCLGLGGFGPWYHAVWIPLALLAPPGFLHRFAVAASVLAPLAYVVWTATRTLGAWHQATVLAAGLVVPAVVAWSRWPSWSGSSGTGRAAEP